MGNCHDRSLGMVGGARRRVNQRSGRRPFARTHGYRSRMTDLPQGMVAYLMSDIEGSTRLVRDLGPAFPALLGDHFRLLGDAVSSNGGTLVSSEGDSIFAVFPSVRQAVLAAVGGQRSLAAHPWPNGATVRVRMGIHAGEAVFGGTDYTGLEVHRTARIMAAGHGGQVLLSAAARSLAGDVGDGIGFRDAGMYQLRDMPAPDEVIQLTAEGLPTDFPPLRTQRPTVPTNLPTPLTRFVGRSTELVTAVGLLNETRLLTLTGPGGTGKTRLSIEVGRNGLDQFPDGVWFVGLDVLRDPALVMTSVGRALGVLEAAGVGPLDALAKHLAGHATLIVLDNLEQVIAAASDVAALLAAAPGLTILATSREPLAIAGERVYAVPPLAVPDEPGNPTAATLVGNDCVDLFVERARAARAEFALTDANAAAVAAICRRLDGLPLALELAAARINVLSPDQILARMDHRLTLLASSRRDLTDRQRTLRGAIEWSYDLLTEPERTFFRRFSVFAGGADLDAAQTVIDPEIDLGADALDLASALVDRSLLRATEAGGANRLVLLETIREYASDRLAEAATEAEAVRNRHAAHYRALAVASAGVLTDPRRDAILDQLDRELPNFRAAIDWAVAAGDLDSAVEIAVSLRDFWHTRAHLVEARQLVGKLLEATGDRPGPSRIRLLFTMSEVASWNGEYVDARRAAAEGSGDRTGHRRPVAARPGVSGPRLGDIHG